MSTLINLFISLLVGFLFGNQQEETKTAQLDSKPYHIEVFQELKTQQQFLEC